jgi:hypothetical protein
LSLVHVIGRNDESCFLGNRSNSIGISNFLELLLKACVAFGFLKKRFELLSCHQESELDPSILSSAG